MSWEAWVTVAVLALVVAALASNRAAPDVVMVGAVTLLLTAGVLSPGEALAGLANEGVATVGVLFVVAAGVRETGGLERLVQRVLGHPRGEAQAQLRMMAPVAAMSAFMNNTPLVAMMVPVVSDWAAKHGIQKSKLLLPLSYAAILGGLCSLIGTSTNLVVSGLLAAHTGRGLGMFDITWLGLPAAVAGMAFVLVAGRWLLPSRASAAVRDEDPRAYTVEMMVEPGSALAGQTIERAGLRHLGGMYLMEIDREGEVLAAVGPETRLEAGDRLIFVGVVESVAELQRFHGLKPATDQLFKLDGPRRQRRLVEAVVSDRSPLAGKSIREGHFRTVYNAVVIAVARSGERLRQKIGDIVLRPGDTLLLEAHPAFLERHGQSRDFFLVSAVRGWTMPRRERAGTAVAILAGMVAAAALEWLTPLNAAMLAAGAMLLTRCVSTTVARRSVDWQVLLAVAASFGLGRALEVTGLADAVAGGLVGLAGTNPRVALAALYGATMLFTEVASNNAAAVLLFPLALSTSQALGVSHMPFVMAVAVAASCGFATPIGYQTNLMVFGPGGYRYSDYLRVGGLLNLLVWAVTVTLAPLVWPFAG